MNTEHPIRIHYFEKDGKYYKQTANWWKKHAMYVPQNPHRISKEEYLRATQQDEETEVSE